MLSLFIRWNSKNLLDRYDNEQMVMQLLGKSLATLHEENGGKFSEKTVYMIGIQLVSILRLAISIQQKKCRILIAAHFSDRCIASS